MDSFALGYLPKSSENCHGDDFGVKVNINLWLQCGWNNQKPVLDLGFMLYNLAEAEKLRLYFPFELNTNDITDLCGIIENNDNLIGAIFNEPYQCVTCKNPKKRKVKCGGDIDNAGDDVPFVLYRIDHENDISLESFKSEKLGVVGTFVDVDTKSIISDSDNEIANISNYYIRLRIRSDKLSGMVREYKNPNRFFETLVNSTYMVEMRFNNTRSMDSTLVEKLTYRDNIKLVPIRSLHFLLMTQISVDVDITPFNSSRVIEKGIWNDYVKDISNNKEPVDVVAYHFKTKSDNDIGSWEFFTRMKVGKIGLIPILICFLLYLAFSVICGVAANWIWNTIF